MAYRVWLPIKSDSKHRHRPKNVQYLYQTTLRNSASCRYIRDGPLTINREGVENIITNPIKFLSPSQIYSKTLFPLQTSEEILQETSYPFVPSYVICHPPTSERARRLSEGTHQGCHYYFRKNFPDFPWYSCNPYLFFIISLDRYGHQRVLNLSLVVQIFSLITTQNCASKWLHRA